MKTIDLETIAKAASSNPQMFIDDLIGLHAEINAFILKYGELGWNTLMQALEQQDEFI